MNLLIKIFNIRTYTSKFQASELAPPGSTYVFKYSFQNLVLQLALIADASLFKDLSLILFHARLYS
jgi:hypothetical protein